MKILITTAIILLSQMVIAAPSNGEISTNDIQFYGLQDMQGQFRTVDDVTMKGKWTVMVIWQSNCKISNETISHYVEFSRRHQNSDNIKTIGISIDGFKGRNRALKFISKNNVVFENFVTDASLLKNALLKSTGDDTLATPMILIFDTYGELRAKQIGAVSAEVIENFIQQEPKISTFE